MRILIMCIIQRFSLDGADPCTAPEMEALREQFTEYDKGKSGCLSDPQVQRLQLLFCIAFRDASLLRPVALVVALSQPLDLLWRLLLRGARGVGTDQVRATASWMLPRRLLALTDRPWPADTPTSSTPRWPPPLRSPQS